MRCNQINGSTNLRSDENGRSISTNTLGIMGIKSFSFIGGTQYHDENDFSAKELTDTSYLKLTTLHLLSAEIMVRMLAKCFWNYC